MATNFPGPQAPHVTFEIAPLLALAYPAAQNKHDDKPVDEAKVPAGHTVGLKACAGQNDPRGHGTWLVPLPQ